ncbi:MAG TPA: hypothetical protein VLG50_06370 [Candidatus Saccharimonadales bacterium]|nr:hypothetical protein [Candidatus Saccharimonadales bacterium]
MKFKIVVCLFIALPLYSSEQETFASQMFTMPNTLTIVSILSMNEGIENCFCNDKRNAQIAQALAGTSLTREDIILKLHTMTQTNEPLQYDPACYIKASALIAFAENKI